MGRRLKSAVADMGVRTPFNNKACDLVLKAWTKLGFSHHLYEVLRSAPSVYNYCETYCAKFRGEGARSSR